MSVVGKVFSKATDLWVHSVEGACRVAVPVQSREQWLGELGGTGSWGAQGWGVRCRECTARARRAGARRVGRARLGSRRLLCGACGDPLSVMRLARGRSWGVAWPGDVAAELEPAVWRRGSSGGARRKDVAGTSAWRVVARWWPCLTVGRHLVQKSCKSFHTS